MSEIKLEKTRNFRSLTVTLAAAFLALSAVVLLIVSSLDMYFNFQNQRKTVAAQQQLIARIAANSVRGFVQEKSGLLVSAANLGDMATTSGERRELILEKLIGLEPAFRQVVLLNAQGETLLRRSRVSDLVSSKLPEHHSSDLLAQISQGKMCISSVYIDDVTSEPLVVVAVPVTDVFGDSKGILMAEVNLKFMWDLVGGMKIGNNGLAYVVNKQGDLIAFGNISRVLKGENLAHLEEVNEFIKGNEATHKSTADISKGIRGTYAVTAHAHLGVPDWAVIVELPVLEAYEPIVMALKLSALTMVLSFTLAIVAGVYLAKRITKPIISLRDATIRIGQGDLDTKIDIKSKNEIGQLAYAFDQMTENLQTTTTSIDKLNQEIAERKKVEETLRQSREQYKTILRTTMDAFWIVDNQGRFLDVNDAYCGLTGYSREKLLSMSIKDVEASETEEQAAQHIEKIVREGGDRFETRHKCKDGRIVDVEVSVNRNTEKKQLFCFLRDITDRKQAEKQLQTLNEELGSTVDKLSQSNRQLQEFVYVASHDLREPVRKISSFGQLLNDSLGSKLEKDDQENLDFMIDGASRMQQMIESLLVYSRVTTKAAEFQRVDLNEAVEHIKGFELAVNLEETKGEITIPEPLPVIKGDPTQIAQLMQNLIGNSLKYHRKGLRPEVTIRAENQDDGMVRIEVADNGIGIKADQCENVFIMFRRLHSRQEYEGTGIGLAICKKIVERHGGKIKVTSTYGEGSTFAFTLPTLAAQSTQEKDLVSSIGTVEAGH